MLLALLLAVLSVVLGAAVGVSRVASTRLIGPIRAAGLGAGVLAVFGQLLPEAAHDVGFFALVPFGLALFGSAAFERWVLRPAIPGDAPPRGPRATLELGLIALAVHQLFEGVALGAVGSGHHGATTAAVAFAISAHTVPLVAMFTLAMARSVGPKGALGRVGVLLAASVTGVGLASIPAAAALVETSHGVVHAAVAGLLLHALLHAAAPLSAVGVAGSPVGNSIAAALGAVLVVIGIVLGDGHHALESSTTWLVLGLALVLTVVVHRAWPHGARLRPVGS
ncbi:MAG: hypothetical protein IPG04_30855 [Polyangiaceae bacterium]|nr:hypothetical protein [Polyangiaceae bacterium]